MQPSITQGDMLSASARSLNRIRLDNRFTVHEIAEIAECSERHIYNVCNGEADLSMAKAERLSRWFAAHGELRMSRCFVDPSHEITLRREGKANGCVNDEITQAVVHLGDIKNMHERRDKEALTVKITALESVLEDLKKERDSL